jgi:hypothetical protein
VPTKVAIGRLLSVLSMRNLFRVAFFVNSLVLCFHLVHIGAKCCKECGMCGF